MTLTRRDLLLAVPAALHGRTAVPGPVAFHYEAVFPAAAVEWYTRFEMLVTGAVLPPSQTNVLRRNRTRLIAYEWSSGFYPGDSVSASARWQAVVRNNASKWLISANPVGGAAAAPGRTALWYDFAEPGLVAARAGYLAELIGSAEYDGIFFDTPGSEQIPQQMLAAFKQRHPQADYDRCQGDFFGALKRKLGPGKTLFLNQGYRHADAMLPHADMDLTESYFAAVEGNTTRFRKWHDPAQPWESIRTPMEQLVMPAARKYPKVRFVHVNYAAGGASLAGRAARYSWAAAHLFGHDAYLIAPGSYASERDEIYFANPGRPRSAKYSEAGGVAWREFENGIVALNSGPGSGKIPGAGLVLPDAPAGYFFPGTTQ
jgi:hypothetical protein